MRTIYMACKRLLSLTAASVLALGVIIPFFTYAASSTALARVHISKSVVESQSFAVNPVTRYFFADQFKTADPNEIDLRYTLQNGTTQTIRFEQFGFTGNRWETARISFITPATARSLVVVHKTQDGSHIIAKNFRIGLGF